MEINANELFGWLAACITIILYFSPIPIFFKLCKNKIKYNETPNLTAILNYFISINWLIYGYLFKDIHIIICYMCASLISFIGVVTYLIFLAKVKLAKAFLTVVIILAITLLLYLILALLIKNEEIVGYICVASSLLSSADPFIVIRKVIKFRNYKYIPIKSSVTKLVSTTCWVIYGFMIINFPLIISNFIGMVFTLIMLFIWNIFKKRKPIIEDVADFSISISKTKPENTVTVV